MPFTTGTNRAALDHIFQKAVWAQPGDIEIALTTTTPAADGTNVTEPVGNGYARIATVPGEWTRTGNDMANNVRQDFPQATGSWGTIVGFVLYDSTDGTTVVGFGALTANQPVASGQQPYFDVGDLVCRYL